MQVNLNDERACESCDGEGRVWNNADPTSGQFHECECVADCFALTDAALAKRVRYYASTCTGLEPRRILQLAADRLERGRLRAGRCICDRCKADAEVRAEQQIVSNAAYQAEQVLRTKEPSRG